MQPIKTVTIRVLRAFLYQGHAAQPGDVLTVPNIFGRELMTANKAEAVAASAPVAPVAPVDPLPPTTDKPAARPRTKQEA